MLRKMFPISAKVRRNFCVLAVCDTSLDSTSTPLLYQNSQELRKTYLRLTKTGKYAHFTFGFHRQNKLDETEAPLGSRLSGMMYSPEEYCEGLKGHSTGKYYTFNVLTRAGALVNLLKILLHGSPTLVEYILKDSVSNFMLNISGALALDYNDMHIFALLDLLVLLRERRGVILTGFASNVYQECCRRALCWPAVKQIKAMDSFIRLYDRPEINLVDLARSIYFRRQTADPSDFNVVIKVLLLYFLSFQNRPLDAVFLKNVQKRVANKFIWKMTLDELCLMSAGLLRNADCVPWNAEFLRKTAKVLQVRSQYKNNFNYCVVKEMCSVGSKQV